MNITKSNYCNFCLCPKMLWMNTYKQSECYYDNGAQSRFTNGNEVGDLAMGLFGDFTEVTTFKDTSDGKKYDYAAMIAKTQECLKNGTQNICEAAFAIDNLYCAVDILRKENGGYAIYEVKSSTEVKDIYLTDVAFQKYVLTKCGINIVGTYIVHINNKYVRGDELEIDKLFKIVDVSSCLADKEKDIKNNLTAICNMLNDKDNEPNIPVSVKCIKPYQCGYYKYCHRNVPALSVLDLYKMDKDERYNYYNKGCVDLADFNKFGQAENGIQELQIKYCHSDKTYIDKDGIKDFLKSCRYPLYFLDFEGEQQYIPKYKGVKAYAQVAFQYSLHYIESEDGELKHKEFLAESGKDPRRAIAESLCRDIPENVTVLAYNIIYECGRLNELSNLFPDLHDHLQNIKSNVIDLITPFRKGYYYKKEMSGNFTIKNVLPALYPDDPELNYHNLDGVQNGTEAMNVYPLIATMTPEDAARARTQLLKYCELDTLALVKVWQALLSASK